MSEDQSHISKALGYMLAAVVLGGLTARLSFRGLVNHAYGLLFILAVLVVFRLFVCLYISPHDLYIFKLSRAGQQPLSVLLCVFSPLILASLLHRFVKADAVPELAVMAMAVFLVLVDAGLAFLTGSMETAVVCGLTIMATAWLAGMPSLSALSIAVVMILVEIGLVPVTCPQLSAGNAEHWTPVAVSCGAFARGSWFGMDEALSVDNVPQDFYNDFLFSSLVGYQLGAFGALLVMILFTFLGVLGFRLASQCQSPYVRLCVAGTTLSFLLPAFMHMGVCTATLPPGRILVPFLSGGGEALIVSWLTLGIVASAIQYDVEAPTQDAAPEHQVLAHFTFWCPMRARVLMTVFAVIMAVLVFRVIVLASDSDMARRFTDYIEESIPAEDILDIVPPRWEPHFEPRKPRNIYHETRLPSQDHQNVYECRQQTAAITRHETRT